MLTQCASCFLGLQVALLVDCCTADKFLSTADLFCQGKTPGLHAAPASSSGNIDCRGYYNCHQGNEPMLSCDAGHRFNHRRMHCDWASNIECPPHDVKGFWYAPFTAGGDENAPRPGMCTPITPKLGLAPGSDSYDMAVFFWGLMPSEWCLGSDDKCFQGNCLNFLTQLKFPGTPATSDKAITNAFEGQKDDFQYKLFTIGGGNQSLPWNADEINYLTEGCGERGSGLIDYFQEAGYNGVMLDYEYADETANGALEKLLHKFETSYPHMTLSFTTQGNPEAGGCTRELIDTLKANLNSWDFVVPQLYDDKSCTYEDKYIPDTKKAFNDAFPAGKVLLGMVPDVPLDINGCDACKGIQHSGVVDYFYRPREYYW